MRVEYTPPREVKIDSGYKLWQKCRNNPISNISFEYFKDGILTFKKTIFQFRNEPFVLYYTIDVVGSQDSWYTEPVEDIKRILPNNLHDKVYYYIDPLGTLILLKGSFHEFTMNEILRCFCVEVVTCNKFALCARSHKAYKAKVFDYLEEASFMI